MFWFQLPVIKESINLVHRFAPFRKEGIGSFLSGRDLDGFLPSKSQGTVSTKDLGVKEAARNHDTAHIDAELSKSAPVEDSQQPR